MILLKQDGTILMFSNECTGQSSKKNLKKLSDIKKYLKQTAGDHKAATSLKVKE